MVWHWPWRWTYSSLLRNLATPYSSHRFHQATCRNPRRKSPRLCISPCKQDYNRVFFLAPSMMSCAVLKWWSHLLDPDTRTRTFRKRNIPTFKIPALVTQPPLRLEFFRLRKQLRIITDGAYSARDNRLYRISKPLEYYQFAKTLTPPGIYFPWTVTPCGGTTLGKSPGMAEATRRLSLTTQVCSTC